MVSLFSIQPTLTPSGIVTSITSNQVSKFEFVIKEVKLHGKGIEGTGDKTS